MTKNEIELEEYRKNYSLIRKKISDLEWKILKEKQKDCRYHEFVYECSNHNSHMYKCTKCGKVEDR